MTLTAGTKLGPYEIIAPLGAGGMGEVFRARDTRLGRDVAIKVLPAAFSADADRLTRFEQEARATASLNHPNIVAVYDIGTHDGAPYIVSELLDGTTLRERLDRGTKRPSDGGSSGSGATTTDSGSGSGRGLSVQKAIDYAVQIARGLSAAHDKGIVHRDLKPENVFVTADGHVKILDFGLAKLVETQPALAGVTALATTPPGTQAGAMLGTVGYMAPEQVRGQTVDHRADIFAFGAILHEMLSGRRAFGGSSAADTISAILEHDPEELPAIARKIPPALVRLVDRCLEKNPAARFQSTRDLTFALEALDTSSTASGVSPRAATRVTGRFATASLVAGALVATAAIATLATWYFSLPASVPVVTRLDLVTPPTTDPFSFALSPSGRHIAFVADADGVSRLWIRSFDQAAARALPGTDGATYPFWAPDERAIGFFAQGKLMRVDASGNVPQVLANAPSGRGGTWNRDGVILFAPETTTALSRIAATGGAATPITQLSGGQGSHRWPQFLPDGRRFVFFVGLGRPDTHGVYIGSLDGQTPTRVLASETAAVYASPGYLLRVLQGVLVAHRFDPGRAAVDADTVPLAQPVGADDGTFRSAFTVSDTGVLAERPTVAPRRQLVWVDRGGKRLSVVGAPDDRGLSNPQLSADGRQVAVDRNVDGNFDVWVIDLTRGFENRFTFDAAVDIQSVWSPDATRIVFRSGRNGRYDLFEKPADGSTDEKPLLVTPEDKTPLDWSRDGRFLLYAAQDPKTGVDLWALPLFGDRKPIPVAQTRFDEAQGQFSPDGRWIAYVSNETGRNEVYVRPFQAAGGKWQLSATGGTYPRWERDGRGVFYITPDRKMIAIPIDASPDMRTVSPGAPIELFQTRLATGANINLGGLSRAQYDVAPDGRFLMNVPADDVATPPITVVLNWPAVKR